MQVLLDARHLLFSLASPASTLVPAQNVESIRRARDKVLQERAADISLDFWRAARPAGDVMNNDDKLNAAKMRAVVSHLSSARCRLTGIDRKWHGQVLRHGNIHQMRIVAHALNGSFEMISFGLYTQNEQGNPGGPV